jgi:hypothetical protein
MYLEIAYFCIVFQDDIVSALTEHLQIPNSLAIDALLE